MEYPKIIDLLENTPNKPGKFRKKTGLKKWWIKKNIQY